MNTRSIHFRLTLWYTALVVVVLVCFGTGTYSRLSYSLYEYLQERVERRLEHIHTTIMPTIATASHDTLARKMREIYAPEEGGRFIRIGRSDGTILYMSGVPKDDSYDPAIVPLYMSYSDKPSAHFVNTGRDQRLYIMGRTIEVDGKVYFIEFGAPSTPIDHVLQELIFDLMIGLPIVIIITTAGGSILIRRALVPVDRIRHTAKQITFTNLRQRLPVVPTGDAIEFLSVTLNQMLERLDQAYQQASRFSADASHELRTPLAVIRGELESLEKNARKLRLPDEMSARLQSALEEIERLSDIVEGLFSLARLDAGEAKAAHVALDLSDLVKSTTEQMQLLGDEKQIAITIDAPQPVFVRGDASRLKQIIVNLLDNAIKYTQSGGSIAMTVRGAPSKGIVIIKDTGIGIPAEDLPYIFDRFFRADKVRSRPYQGAGLGLSIVHSICQAHGGNIRAESTEEGGTTITVEIPVTSAITAV